MEYKSTLEKQVEARLKNSNTTPNVSVNNGTEGDVPTDLTKMSYAERLELYNKNPQLYMQLARG